MKKKIRKVKRVTKKSIKESVRQEASHLGASMEQKLANDIVNALGVKSDNLDAAFIGAYLSLTGRMLRFFDVDTVHQMVADEAYDAETCTCETHAAMRADTPVGDSGLN
jgi:hypothetical protein